MSKSKQIFLTVAFCSLTIAPALNAICQLCEDIREHNKQNPSSGYTYYEDYLEAQGKKKQDGQTGTQPSGGKNEDKKAP